ncbi:MAG: VWA domain-containing protein [Phycisphaerae bacterium]|nr:VWA domain-containing protein [Phycisphaerae bacterium]
MKYLEFANHVQANKTEHTVVVSDLSPSMAEEDLKPSRKVAAIKAFHELVKIKDKYHPQDKMAVIGFYDIAEVLHNLVTIGDNFNSLQMAFSGKDGGYGTDFNAALELAESCLFNQPVKANNGFFLQMLTGIFIEPDSPKTNIPDDANVIRRIIMLTDGEHNGGGNPVDIARNLKSAGVIIDCIGIGGSPEAVDEELLKQIASANPDGSKRYCFIGDQQQLIQKYQSLAHHIQIV